MVLTLEAWLLIIFSILVLIFLLIILRWRTHYPVYVIFFISTGLFATWISHILVLRGYLQFPFRPFKDFTLNNIIYDLFLFPGFLLLIIEVALKMRKTWLAVIFFISFTTLQDYLVERYTMLLSYNKWTLIHTVSGSCIAFIICLLFYIWLEKYFSINRRW